MKDAYDRFALHYDQVMGDRSLTLKRIDHLLKTHARGARSLLDLGCGTGVLLQHLPQRLSLTGVDLSKRMLKIARKRAPNAKLYCQDISNLKIEANFDVVTCLFDTMNHLTEFRKWQAVFRHANSRLNPDGVFIFDINTIYRLQRYTKELAYAEIGKESISIVDIFPSGKNRFLLELYMLKQIRPNLFQQFKTQISELAVPVKQIKSALTQHFSKVSVWDPDRKKPGPYSEELYFICRR